MTALAFLHATEDLHVCLFWDNKKNELDYFAYCAEDDTVTFPESCILVAPDGLLTYFYTISMDGTAFGFHLFCEVGEPYKDRLDLVRRELPIVTMELPRAPWLAEYYATRAIRCIDGKIVYY